VKVGEMTILNSGIQFFHPSFPLHIPHSSNHILNSRWKHIYNGVSKLFWLKRQHSDRNYRSGDFLIVICSAFLPSFLLPSSFPIFLPSSLSTLFHAFILFSLLLSKSCKRLIDIVKVSILSHSKFQQKSLDISLNI
jgi:hypothetical protein